MVKYIADPINFVEFTQTQPMSFIFRDHYFKLIETNHESWSPNFIFPNEDNLKLNYEALSYTYRVGAIFPSPTIMNADDSISEEDIDDDTRSAVDEFMEELVNTASDHHKTSTYNFIQEIATRHGSYDELMMSFALYFDVTPYNIRTGVVFKQNEDSYENEYQITIYAISHANFDKYASKMFNGTLNEFTLNNKIFDFKIRKIADKTEVLDHSPILSAKTTLHNNMKYGVKGIYSSKVILNNSLGPLSDIATKIENNSFVPMPFELKVDDNFNVPSSKNENDEDYYYNRNAILSQYGKYAYFIMPSAVLKKVQDVSESIFTNDGIMRCDSPDRSHLIKFMPSIRVQVAPHNTVKSLHITIDMMPSRLIFKGFTAAFNVTATSINNHTLRIALDDGYDGKEDNLDTIATCEAYNVFHHAFFSSYLNSKWNKLPLDILSGKAVPKMPFSYISFIASHSMQSKDEKAEWDDIQVEKYFSNEMWIVNFISTGRTKMFCPTIKDAKALRKKLDNNSMDVPSTDIFYPIISSPTLILYKSLAPIKKGKPFDIRKWDYFGICNIVYNDRPATDDITDKISSTDVLNWLYMSNPFIENETLNLIPITADLIIIRNPH